MKSLFTPEATGAVIQSVRAGLSISDAAERAGLAYATVRNWLAQVAPSRARRTPTLQRRSMLPARPRATLA